MADSLAPMPVNRSRWEETRSDRGGLAAQLGREKKSGRLHSFNRYQGGKKSLYNANRRETNKGYVRCECVKCEKHEMMGNIYLGSAELRNSV